MAAADLTVQHANNYPTRLAQGTDGKFYVSDAQAGSVFIYDDVLNLIGELKNLDTPLGLAVSPNGNIYVGNDGRNNIEVYSTAGELRFIIDNGNILKPNDIILDRGGNLYVADSDNNTVKVYNATGRLLRNIGGPGDGVGQFNFPSSLAIAYRPAAELFVADQGHAKVQVFNADNGTFLRAYGAKVTSSKDWQGKFMQLQSLSIDVFDRLHAVDCLTNMIQIINADNGTYIDSYGEFGLDPGQLNVPLDILISDMGWVAVANSGNHRVEFIYSMEYPTLIHLSSFTVTPKSGQVIISWRTDAEIDNAGFNLYRATTKQGKYTCINSMLIPAGGSPTQGSAYTFADVNVSNGKRYWYKLEDIDLNGNATVHGPKSGRPRLIKGLNKN